MYSINKLFVVDLCVEHQDRPLGLDCASPRFGWKLKSDAQNVKQTAYRLILSTNGQTVADTGRIESEQSIEVTVKGLHIAPKTAYRVSLTVWDNYGRSAYTESGFESGGMGLPFQSSWIEPVQEPTPSSMDSERDGDTIANDAVAVDENGHSEQE